MNYLPTTCLPWLATADPDAEQETLTHLFIERIEQQAAATPGVTYTAYEKSEAALKRILTKCYNQLDPAFDHWNLWVKWRHGK
jgi:hypothetical protein